MNFMIKAKQSIVTLVAIVLCATGYVVLTQSKDPTEAQRVAVANNKYYKEIFSRCSDIRPLSQFIELFHPSEALEFFDNKTMKEVESVVSVVELAGGYKASFVAPVSISETGKYRLTGQPTFTIQDCRGGVFTKIYPNGSTTGSSIQLGPVLWNRFVASGADIQSLREVKVHSKDA